MQEPIFLGFTDTVQKTKKLLIILSSISIFLIYGDLTINQESSFIGLKFEGLNNNLIYTGFLVIIIYNFIVFLWSGYSTFEEWQVRQSGMKTFNASAENDYFYIKDNNTYLTPTEPRNSTLYYWWITQASKTTGLNKTLENLEKTNNKIYKLLQEIESKSENKIFIDNQTSYTATHFSKSFEELAKVAKSFKVIENALNSKNIEISLGKFDKRFKTLLYSQNLKWIILDFAMPILISSFAIYILCNQIF